jgi:hypothetical protein
MITQTLTTSFKIELLQGVHNFGTTISPYDGDDFYIALYDSTASLGADTTEYSTTGELVTANGYTAGGQLLTVSTSPTAGTSTTAYVSFDNAEWTSASFTAAGALIYNSTQGNKSVAVLNFGNDKTANGTFTITFPSATSTTAIIRIA